MSYEKPHFIFTRLSNSFSVHIPNMQELSVKQIQEIEKFVSQRKGVFDFATFTFVIQKRLEYVEFLSLMQHTGMEVECEEKFITYKTQEKIAFGKYKGMKIIELSDSYLLWLKSNYRGSQRALIENEIQRRTL